jgi:hypothetical protein
METVSGVSQSISELGFMAVTSAAYLICSASILFFFIKWSVQIINNHIEREQKILDEILALEREQLLMLKQLLELYREWKTLISEE